MAARVGPDWGGGWVGSPHGLLITVDPRSGTATVRALQKDEWRPEWINAAGLGAKANGIGDDTAALQAALDAAAREPWRAVYLPGLKLVRHDNATYRITRSLKVNGAVVLAV